ncbi:hypothetical protein C8P63_10688 [Melghirimyces profundicolus]|uniref:PfkB family carbohydrate kinase n=1 Tax=Melghirimyces profundicolus TaxID=1242148 RepID=A0A2T6C0J1_9BACL|nr:hypothetical protein [Melghirimyces profundicolus]PTX61836.1 hypothetical protein C8P63_10688 [Melghirimyces profundicolus]
MSEGAVVILGEIMLRLSPPGAKRIVQAENFDLVYGGVEANVAVSLSCSVYVPRLPENRDAVGQSLRPAQVIYDRETSAMAEATPEDFD